MMEQLEDMMISILISIHAPRVGSDVPFVESQAIPGNFYPRSPRGERLIITSPPIV